MEKASPSGVRSVVDPGPLSLGKGPTRATSPTTVTSALPTGKKTITVNITVPLSFFALGWKAPSYSSDFKGILMTKSVMQYQIDCVVF